MAAETGFLPLFLFLS